MKAIFFPSLLIQFLKYFFSSLKEKAGTYLYMYAEDYCSSAIRSSLFGSNSSRLLLSAVKDRVIFTSVLHLTAGTWFCWGLQWQGLRLEGTGAIMAFVAVLLAASLQAWSVASKCIRVCVKVGLRGASLALVVVVWRGRCSDLFVLVCATGKGPGKCKAGKMPMLPGEMSLPSQECRWCGLGELFWVSLFTLTLLLFALVWL